MPGPNISRVEAEERSSHITLHSYEVTLKVVPGVETFYSKSVVKFSCNTPGYETFADASARKIISATVNGVVIDISSYDGKAIYLNNLQAENELIVEMEAIFSKNGEGLQYSTDPSDGESYVYSTGQASLMRHMYPCFDQPDLKATFALTAIVPAAWEAIGNTTCTSKTENGDGYATWVFPPTPRLSTYITVFIAGPYHHVHDEYVGQKEIPLGIYCRKSLAPHLDHEEIFKVTKQGLEYFEKVFGLAYPFEKYDQIAVVDFNWGAMENVGAVTFKEDLFVYRSRVTERVYKWRASTILHEMAHMWFGNMVTMKWWNDIWLNESFAEWVSYLALTEATDYKNGWVEFNSRRKNWAYKQDQLSSTHPIVVDMKDIEEANANFDGITYAKGASVLQQFVAHVGRENFIKGLQNYFAKHAFKNTTLDDLIIELEATSGRDLTIWISTWLKTAGVNTLRPEIKTTNGVYESIKIIQEPPLTPAGSAELRPHRLAVGLYDLQGEKIKLRKSIELDVSGAITEVEGLKNEREADLVLLNDGDLTYSKIRFDSRSIDTLKAHLGKLDDPLARAVCWSAVWDMLRDAEISSVDFEEIAHVGLPSETEISVATAVTDQLATAVDLYTDSSQRFALRERIANSLDSLLRSAEPGSDLQLLYANAFANLATSQEQNQEILTLLNGELDGLIVDVDLRWTLIKAAAARGLLSKEKIDEEKVADPSTLGELHYFYAMAAKPLENAKANAWARIIDESTSNAIRVSLAQGFNRPMQDEFVTPYIDNYFDNLLKAWNWKSQEAASEFAEQMFPIYVANQSILNKANIWLEITGKDAPSGLRRVISESRDALARALKVQAVGGVVTDFE